MIRLRHSFFNNLITKNLKLKEEGKMVNFGFVVIIVITLVSVIVTGIFFWIFFKELRGRKPAVTTVASTIILATNKEEEKEKKKRKRVKRYRMLWILLLAMLFALIGWYMNKLILTILSSGSLKDMVALAKIRETLNLTGIWLSWSVVLWTWYIIPFCLIVVGGQDHGVKTFFGVPYAYIDSGLHLVLWPVEKIYIYTKIRQRINIEKQEVVTKSEDDSHGEKKDKKTTNGNKLFALTPTIDATLYYSYPRNENLIEVYQSVSREFKEIAELLIDPIQDGIRTAASEKNWQECTQKEFQKAILDKLEDKPIRGARGMFDYEVEITTLLLPDDFKKSLSEKLAVIAKAEGEKRGIALKGEGEAEARKILFETIKHCDNWELLEAFLSFRKMAEGDNKWIIGLPDSLRSVLGTITGNNDSLAPRRR